MVLLCGLSMLVLSSIRRHLEDAPISAVDHIHVLLNCIEMESLFRSLNILSIIIYDHHLISASECFTRPPSSAPF